MIGDSRQRPGVFEPEEVQEMQEDLEREGYPGESDAEREARAFEIVQRKEMEQSGQ